MKPLSSVKLLGLLVGIGLLPHTTLALPTTEDNITTSSTFSNKTLQIIATRSERGVNIQQCIQIPNYWLSCCKHATNWFQAKKGDCWDYSDPRLQLDEIGNCEKGKKGEVPPSPKTPKKGKSYHKILSLAEYEKRKNHGPCCTFEPYYGRGWPLLKKGDWGRYTP